jgi:hypothetical protein
MSSGRRSGGRETSMASATGGQLEVQLKRPSLGAGWWKSVADIRHALWFSSAAFNHSRARLHELYFRARPLWRRSCP